MLATYDVVQRAVKRLNSLMTEIPADTMVTDAEIYHLSQWLAMYRYMKQSEPFGSIVQMVENILLDGFIEKNDREDVLELCWAFNNESMICRYTASAVIMLQSVLKGILEDNPIRENEAIELKCWLAMHEIVKNCWPFSDLWKPVRRILSDGALEENEKDELNDFLTGFTALKTDDRQIHDGCCCEACMQKSTPVLLPFPALCDRESKIVFNNRTFCFTGKAVTGPYKELHALVESVNGIPAVSIGKDLDYLVIGAHSCACWAYSTYGRTIEKAIELQKGGAALTMLHEDDFVGQLAV